MEVQNSWTTLQTQTIALYTHCRRMWRPKQITKLGRTGLQQIHRSLSVPKGQLSHFARKYDPDAWNQLKGSIPSLLARVRCLPLKTWHLKRVGINYRHQWEHYTAWKAAESFSCCSLGEVALLFVKLEIVKLTKRFSPWVAVTVTVLGGRRHSQRKP